jgi:hypothetical protein
VNSAPFIGRERVVAVDVVPPINRTALVAVEPGAVAGPCQKIGERFRHGEIVIAPGRTNQSRERKLAECSCERARYV